MKSTFSRTTRLLLAAAALFSAGCRADRHAVELLERDNRLLEDKIYELQDVIREYQDALEASPMRSETDYKDSSDTSIEQTESPDTTEPRALTDAPDAPRMINPRPSFDRDDKRPGKLVPPVVEFPEEVTAPQEPKSGGLQIPEVPDHIKNPSGNDSLRGNTDDKSTRNEATHLFIDADLCGGYDDDNNPGDDGISVSIKPRNAQGQTVGTAGDLIVVVRDPQLSGSDAYVARWEFTAEQLAEVFDASSGGGLNLTLSWPDRRPQHESLDLFVRYTTADGRRLDASEPIGVRLADSTSDGWTLARNPVRTRRVERTAVAGAVAENVRPEREEVVQAVHEEPVAEEKPAASSRPAWSPNRP